MDSPIFVFDTNAFISAHLIQNSVSAQVYDEAFAKGRLAVSEDVLSEYVEVLYRSKFDKYLTTERREEIIEKLRGVAITVKPVETITACRDRKDNIFLELALAADASYLISGDPDLLVLHPFRGIPIISASGFLQNL